MQRTIIRAYKVLTYKLQRDIIWVCETLMYKRSEKIAILITGFIEDLCKKLRKSEGLIINTDIRNTKSHPSYTIRPDMAVYTEKTIFPFHVEWDMIVVTVFLSILSQMEFHLVQNRKENYHPDYIPLNVKGNGNIVFSV